MKSASSVGSLIVACAAGLAVGAMSAFGSVSVDEVLWIALSLFLVGVGATVLRGRNRDHELAAERDRAVALESSYLQLTDNLPVGLFIRRSGEFVSTNWEWDDQMMREPVVAPQVAFERAVGRDEWPLLRWQIEAAESQEESLRMEYRTFDHSGHERYFEWRSVPVFRSDGELDHFIGFNLDITSLKRTAIALQAKHHDLNETYEELQANLEAMIRAMVKAIEAKDPYTAGHTERVTRYALQLADAIGVSEQDRLILRMGTLLHDIGKLGVPDHILTKPSGLTDEEFEIIKMHPAIGANVIEDIPYFKACVPIVRWHHERLNGRGYPDGLAGDEIPLLVRIATIADMYDAMTSTRAYRKAMSPSAALSELKKDVLRGSLDPDLVAAWEIVLADGGLLNEDQAEAA